MTPRVLSIAGTDPSGGAGAQADLKAFSANGAYGMSALTAVVAQNTQGVRQVVTLDASFVAEQIAAVCEDVHVDAIKIGMVANTQIITAIAEALDRYAECPVVLDPVMVAKSGDQLLDPDAVAALKEQLVPRSTLITPNLPEASLLIGREREISSLAEMYEALPELCELSAEWVLLKGGHLVGGINDGASAERRSGHGADEKEHNSETAKTESIDLLAHTPSEVTELRAPRVHTKNTHGTGCTLSAAIAALWPQRDDPAQAVREAKDYLTGALNHADELHVGHGHGPVHHFFALWPPHGEQR